MFQMKILRFRNNCQVFQTGW